MAWEPLKGDPAMAYRNGVIPSSIPFEQRCQPPKRRKREPMTKIDRLVCAICGSVLGLFLWTTSYMILFSMVMRAGARHPAAASKADPADLLPPFWWGATVAVAFAGYGTVVGAERMMDGFEKAVHVQGKVADAINRS
jgi:hypothetical protein